MSDAQIPLVNDRSGASGLNAPRGGVSAGEENLLAVTDLAMYFPVRQGIFSTIREWVKAVDGVSFSIPRGKTLGLVGESGCGKTTVGRAILRLLGGVRGSVIFDGRDVHQLSRSELRQLRRRMQIIFQDPYGSLNPRMTVGSILAEPLTVHGIGSRQEIKDRVRELLQQVGLPEQALHRYPHEFSGGQRQRIGIARALALKPDFIVCDEPTSALDVSIRAQVINLLHELQETRRIAYLFISHDLGVVRYVSHNVAVMYLGKIVESAPTQELFERPSHPYTRVLLAAIPVPDPTKRRERITATDDEIPSPINIPRGCPFHPRCPLYALKNKPQECHTLPPPLKPLAGGKEHLVACHFPEETEVLKGKSLGG